MVVKAPAPGIVSLRGRRGDHAGFYLKHNVDDRRALQAILRWVDDMFVGVRDHEVQNPSNDFSIRIVQRRCPGFNRRGAGRAAAAPAANPAAAAEAMSYGPHGAADPQKR